MGIIDVRAMGQAAMKELPFKIDDIKDDVMKQVQILREMAVLTYPNFLAMVKDLNQMSQQAPDNGGRCLLFVVKGGSDSSVFWKGTVRIGCFRCLATSLTVSHDAKFCFKSTQVFAGSCNVIYTMKKIEDNRLLNLKQFLLVYKMINYHIRPSPSMTVENGAHCASGMTKNALSTSMILDTIGASEAGSDMEECCICMERKPEITLPCAHSYCLLCIEQWNVSHKTCPLCREALESTDESWVLPEIPESSEVNEELQKALNGLTMKLPDHTT